MSKSEGPLIGMFDSGVGGLTVMQEFKKQMPSTGIIYFGDTAKVPYGGKSPETIIRYSIENAIFLLEKNIKILVIACNTVSAIALEKLRHIFKIPIIGVIDPGAENASAVTRNQRIAILGTKATIDSEAYQTAIKKRLPEAVLFPLACPLFVPLVEERFFTHPAARMIVKEYLSPLKDQNIDTILLGCTHYPFLRDLIREEMGELVSVVDSASMCAKQAAGLLKDELYKISQDEYYVSDDPVKFKILAEGLFGKTLPAISMAKP